MALKDDFKYNLRLLDERDLELAKNDEKMGKVKGSQLIVVIYLFYSHLIVRCDHSEREGYERFKDSSGRREERHQGAGEED